MIGKGPRSKEVVAAIKKYKGVYFGAIGGTGALIAKSALNRLSKRMNPSRYNGASLLGLRGLVFKSHGGADAYGYGWAIRRAFDAAQLDVVARISTTIAALMPLSEAMAGSADLHAADPAPATNNDLSEPKTA